MAPSKIPVPVSAHSTASLKERQGAQKVCATSLNGKVYRFGQSKIRPLAARQSTSSSASTSPVRRGEQHGYQQKQQQQEQPPHAELHEQQPQNQCHQRERERQGNIINGARAEPTTQVVHEIWSRTRSMSDSTSMMISSSTSNSGSTSYVPKRTLSRRTRSESLSVTTERLSLASSSSNGSRKVYGYQVGSGQHCQSQQVDSTVSVVGVDLEHFRRRSSRQSQGKTNSKMRAEGHQYQVQETIPSPTTPVPGSCVFLEDTTTGDRGIGCIAIARESTSGLNTLVTVADAPLLGEAFEISPAPATVRKCHSTHVYFLDHYIDLLSYLKKRQERLQAFKISLSQQSLPINEVEQAWTEFRCQERLTLRQRRTRTQAVQFQILTQVGQGGFGEVFLARKEDTNELCALKRMSKKHLHLQDEVQHILTERDVLTATKSEWHVRLLYSFQDVEYVYLAMEFVQGGDVRTMLTARGVLTEEDTKLYFSEMVMAIDALHQQGYIHRDLKPENFLIDQTGHIKLTDFGLSKGQLAESRIEALKAKLMEVKNNMEPALPTLRRGGSSMMMHSHHLCQNNQNQQGGLEVSMAARPSGGGGSFANLNGILHRSPSHMLWNGSSSNLESIASNSLLNLHTADGAAQRPQECKNEGIRRAFSIVGSADYMAPEILASKGYDYGVDYWSLGCILFEFLCGYSPFQAEDTRQTCVNVWHWRKVLQRPVYDTEENLEFNLTDEAWDLITWLITDREERLTTMEQVKDHPWLAGLDWSSLRSAAASFVPVLSTPMDTSYFDDFSNPEDMLGYKDVLLRQAQVQEAEAAAAAETSSDSEESGLRRHGPGQSSESLPQILRVQDPWKGAFVGFTFRHHCHGEGALQP